MKYIIIYKDDFGFEWTVGGFFKTEKEAKEFAENEIGSDGYCYKILELKNEVFYENM